ncbi:MAG TPA: hypothetical protein VFA65_20270 [Bryobacteraceae bacterium]|nr:hypothetical protein [Bryobacteraceae bacterium]
MPCGEEAFDFEVLETLDDDLPTVGIPDILQDKKRSWATDVGGHAL